jgi:hypothetical protein
LFSTFPQCLLAAMFGCLPNSLANHRCHGVGLTPKLPKETGTLHNRPGPRRICPLCSPLSAGVSLGAGGRWETVCCARSTLHLTRMWWERADNDWSHNRVTRTPSPSLLTPTGQTPVWISRWWSLEYCLAALHILAKPSYIVCSGSAESDQVLENDQVIESCDRPVGHF